MALGLSKVFSSVTKPKLEEVTEPQIYTIKNAQEAYYRYLFPQDTKHPLSLPQKLVINVVQEALQKKPARQKAVPHLPHVIPRLMRSLRDPDSSVKDYVEIINKDPVMSAAVLKLGNSIYFNPLGKRIDNIERAVVKLGIDGLRAVLSAAVMQPIIQRESAYFSQCGQRMWQHSLNTAVACEIIAKHTHTPEPFKVYLLGLVHDIGKTTIFSELCKQFKQNGEKISPGYNAFVPLMKVLSPAVSYWVAKDWELPTEICKALAEQVNISAGNKVSPYAHILYKANMVTEIYTTSYANNKKLASSVLAGLDLPENMFDTLDTLSLEL